MPSFADRLALLVSALEKEPPRINAYDDLPFAVFQYDIEAEEESEARLREEMRRIKLRLEGKGKRVETLSLGPFLWAAIASARGLDALFEHEERTAFGQAQDVVAGWLVDEARYPLSAKIAAAINAIAPSPDVVLLYRASVFAPTLAAMSSLLKGMHGKVRIPTVLFYPGKRETEFQLRYMGLSQRELPSSYHVQVY